MSEKSASILILRIEYNNCVLLIDCRCRREKSDFDNKLLVNPGKASLRINKY